MKASVPALLALVLLALRPGAATAAQTTWADPAGLCNGQSPCFTTLAAAVANAGPPPATVFAFPGTYAESVDLGTMGSALPGGVAGELSLVSVDAAGLPAPGAVVDPSVPGGPGTGSAIFANPFPGAVTVDGFVVRSPDDNNLALFGPGPAIEVANVTADGSPSGNGIVVATDDGDILIADSIARLNDAGGIVALSVGGAVTVSGCFAERNGEAGFALIGAAITVSDSQAEANAEEGFFLSSTTGGASVAVSSIDASLNDRGLVVQPGGPTPIATVAVDGAAVASNLTSGLLVLADQITATGVAATGNGDVGAFFFGTVVEVTDSTAESNLDAGLALGGEQVVGERLTATGNGGIGIGVVPQLGAASFTLVDLTATGNGSGVLAGLGTPGLTFASGTISGCTAAGNQDSGVDAGAETLLLDQVTATGNGGVGITALALDNRLTACQAAGNLAGVVATGERVTILDSSATANGPFGGGTFDGNGFVLADVDRADVTDTLALDNEVGGWLILDFAAPALPDGVDPTVAHRELERLAQRLPQRAPALGGAPATQAISIATSRTEGNVSASMRVALRAEGTLAVRCSDFVANGPSGLALFTDNAVDARGNFWDALSGPQHPGNPGGAGDVIQDGAAGFAGTVLYDPFSTAAASASDCVLPGEVLEIPTLGPLGLGLLGLALVLAAWTVLRRRRCHELPPAVVVFVALAGCLALGASAAEAATEVAAISASPDTTAVFGALELRDQGVFADDLQGTLAPVSLGSLPEAVAVDAYHDPGDGNHLFSLDGWADLGGLPVTPADVVAWDGSAYSLAFDAVAAGVPAGADVDAVTAAEGELLLSFDVTVDLPGGPYADADLVRWDGAAFSLGFRGAAAGVPAGAGVDAAHRLDNGNLLLSFDVGGTAGGVVFADEDVLEHDPVAGSWELVYDGSAEHPAWVAPDLDALSVGEPPAVVEIPTLSTLALALLALILAAAGLRLTRRPDGLEPSSYPMEAPR